VSTPSFTIASASGNIFAYAWEDEAGSAFDGARWARAICPKGTGLGLDGLFLVRRAADPWILDHWDPDGSFTFCSNGTRAALALADAPRGEVRVLSSGLAVTLRRQGDLVGIRMPEGPGMSLGPSPLPTPSIRAWIGNPQLILEVDRVEDVDLASMAPPLRRHPAFPEGTNVSVLALTGPGSARIRTWERGVEGETLCCGTGCAAAGAWLIQRTGRGLWRLQPAAPDPVDVEGRVEPDGRWRDLWVSGPVRTIGRFTPLP
jgi:diaminopimelate epimerase